MRQVAGIVGKPAVGARRLLGAAALVLVVVVSALPTALSENAEALRQKTIVKTGHIASDRPDWVYVPFRVPAGVSNLHVAYSYNRDPGNALDIGIFDPDGIGLGNQQGFRGWSGGFAPSSPSPGVTPRPHTSPVTSKGAPGSHPRSLPGCASGH